MGGDLLGRLLIAQAADAVGLPGAHLLQQAEIGPVPLVVADGADAVDEVDLFAVHVFLQIPAAPGDGVQKQLAHQLGHGLQQFFTAQGEAIVDTAGHKAHALTLAIFADGRGDGGAIEGIHGGGQGLHIRIAHGAAVQDRRQKCVIGCPVPVQRRDELGGKTAGFEFPGGQDREVDIGHEFFAIFVHQGFLLLYNQYQLYCIGRGKSIPAGKKEGPPRRSLSAA